MIEGASTQRRFLSGGNSEGEKKMRQRPVGTEKRAMNRRTHLLEEPPDVEKPLIQDCFPGFNFDL